MVITIYYHAVSFTSRTLLVYVLCILHVYIPLPMTAENAIGVVEKVTDGRSMKVWGWLFRPDVLEDIKSKY